MNYYQESKPKPNMFQSANKRLNKLDINDLSSSFDQANS